MIERGDQETQTATEGATRTMIETGDHETQTAAATTTATAGAERALHATGNRGATTLLAKTQHPLHPGNQRLLPQQQHQQRRQNP